MQKTSSLVLKSGCLSIVLAKKKIKGGLMQNKSNPEYSTLNSIVILSSLVACRNRGEETRRHSTVIPTKDSSTPAWNLIQTIHNSPRKFIF